MRGRLSSSVTEPTVTRYHIFFTNSNLVTLIYIIYHRKALCTLYSPNLNALLYQIVRKWNIQNKYFLYFKYKIHVLYFVTFSGTSILYFLLIHLFEGYFVFCIKIHFDVFLPISAPTVALCAITHGLLQMLEGGGGTGWINPLVFHALHRVLG